MLKTIEQNGKKKNYIFGIKNDGCHNQTTFSMILFQEHPPVAFENSFLVIVNECDILWNDLFINIFYIFNLKTCCSHVIAT